MNDIARRMLEMHRQFIGDPVPDGHISVYQKAAEEINRLDSKLSRYESGDTKQWILDELELRAKVKDLETRLEKALLALGEMSEAHVKAVDRLDKAELALTMTLKELTGLSINPYAAAEIAKRYFAVEKQSTNVTAHVHRFEGDPVGACACGMMMVPAGWKVISGG